MLALKGYVRGSTVVTDGLIGNGFDGKQVIITVLDEGISAMETAPERKSCRGIAAEYADAALIPKEAEIASAAFSGNDDAHRYERDFALPAQRH